MGKIAIEGAERGTVFKLDPDSVVVIGHDTKHKRGEHPLWQARALEPADEAMAQHMAQHGFTSVIDVRKDGPNLEVIVGRRRVKAARRANEIRQEQGQQPLKISVQVKKVGSNAELVGLMVAENALRKDVEPIEMARDLQQMLDFGASEEQVARSWGRGLQQLRNMLKLLDLSPEVQEAVREKSLTPTAAAKLSELPREQQVEELGKISRGETKATGSAVASAVRAKKNGHAEAVHAPSKRDLRRLIEADDAERVLGEDGIKAIRFALGDISARQITGLAALLRSATEK